MSQLPQGFHFSQASLQDYKDCARRFELRYVLERRWPAQETQPALESERRLQRGAAFHRLLHRHQVGVPRERLEAALDDEDLQTWWRRYLDSVPTNLPPERYPEMTLSTPLAGFRLLAKYDLLAIAPGQRAVIMDWKTGKPQRKSTLRKRLQTVVYPYVLVRAGAGLNAGQPLAPERVEMTYWQAQASQAGSSARMTVTFDYSDDQYREDEARISELIQRIADTPPGHFHMTTINERCKFCCYRSLCDRGKRAGDVSEIDIDDLDAEPDTGIDLDFDFGQIAEIQF